MTEVLDAAPMLVQGVQGCCYTPDVLAEPMFTVCGVPAPYVITAALDGRDYATCTQHAAWARAAHPELIAEIRSVDASW